MDWTEVEYSEEWSEETAYYNVIAWLLQSSQCIILPLSQSVCSQVIGLGHDSQCAHSPHSALSTQSTGCTPQLRLCYDMQYIWLHFHLIFLHFHRFCRLVFIKSAVGLNYDKLSNAIIIFVFTSDRFLWQIMQLIFAFIQRHNCTTWLIPSRTVCKPNANRMQTKWNTFSIVKTNKSAVRPAILQINFLKRPLKKSQNRVGSTESQRNAILFYLNVRSVE